MTDKSLSQSTNDIHEAIATPWQVEFFPEQGKATIRNGRGSVIAIIDFPQGYGREIIARIFSGVNGVSR